MDGTRKRLLQLEEEMKENKERDLGEFKEQFESDACAMEIEAKREFETEKQEVQIKQPELEAKLNEKQRFITHIIHNN